MQPHGPVARRRNLIVFEVQELVGRHVIGQDIPPVGFKHYRKNQTMEHNVVFPDEMNEPSFLVFPPRFPLSPLLGLMVAELFRIGYVAYRRIEPHVKYLSVGPIYRNRDAPIEVSRHCTGLQIHV